MHQHEKINENVLPNNRGAGQQVIELKIRNDPNQLLKIGVEISNQYGMLGNEEEDKNVFDHVYAKITTVAMQQQLFWQQMQMQFSALEKRPKMTEKYLKRIVQNTELKRQKKIKTREKGGGQG